MGNLINKVGSYELILNELDDKTNASNGTYIPGKNRIIWGTYKPLLMIHIIKDLRKFIRIRTWMTLAQ